MSRGGAYVVVAGPDGSGKSTLAPRLVDEARRAGKPATHLHWRPGVLPLAGNLVGNEPGDASNPHAREPHGKLVSWGRLFYYWVDFLIGSWTRIRSVRSRGGLVVMERGWWDFAVDLRRYRLRVHPSLVRALGRLLPSPDLVLVLRASPEVLATRKTELPSAELERQNEAWRHLDLPSTVKSFLDASMSVEQLVEEATVQILEVSSSQAMGNAGVE